MRRAAVVCLFVALIALAYAGWRSVRAAGDVCKVCLRPIHAGSRTVGLVGGKRVVFCCPACAMSEEQQAAGVRTTEMTDFASGRRLAPDKAYLVRGSDVNLCLMHEHAPVEADYKRPAVVSFDRCRPGLLAFAERSEAERFIAAHGGVLVEPPH